MRLLLSLLLVSLTSGIMAASAGDVVICPPNAIHEGEPDCFDGYYDDYNGGCGDHSGPASWVEICPENGAAAELCGRSGTYLYNGLSYRDTDWIRVFGNGSVLTETCTADFPLLMFFIYGTTNCGNLLYEYVAAAPGETVSLSRVVERGAEAWMWVGPSVFTGIPCGSDYVMSLTGIWCQSTATEKSTWGTVKSLYR